LQRRSHELFANYRRGTAARHFAPPCSSDGSPFTHSELKDIVPRTCRKAGLAKRLTKHDLRHTFASHPTMRGVTPVAVKELLGHADLRTAMRYAHLAPSITRDAVQLLNSRPHSTWTPETKKPRHY
jgi:site-specific recombinase XerD